MDLCGEPHGFFDWAWAISTSSRRAKMWVGYISYITSNKKSPIVVPNPIMPCLPLVRIPSISQAPSGNHTWQMNILKLFRWFSLTSGISPVPTFQHVPHPVPNGAAGWSALLFVILAPCIMLRIPRSSSRMSWNEREKKLRHGGGQLDGWERWRWWLMVIKMGINDC